MILTSLVILLIWLWENTTTYNWLWPLTKGSEETQGLSPSVCKGNNWHANLRDKIWRKICYWKLNWHIPLVWLHLGPFAQMNLDLDPHRLGDNKHMLPYRTKRKEYFLDVTWVNQANSRKGSQWKHPQKPQKLDHDIWNMSKNLAQAILSKRNHIYVPSPWLSHFLPAKHLSKCVKPILLFEGKDFHLKQPYSTESW